VISEARFYSDSNKVMVSIPQYELVQSKTLENNDFKYSRIHVYKHESVVAKVRLDLMDSSVSSVWMSLGFKHQRKILVGGFYRTWQHLGRADNGASGTDAAQMSRWKVFLDQWERALKEGKEVITMGDFNLDWPTCIDQQPAPGTKAYRTRHLAEQLAIRILSRGVTQLVRGVTRSWPGQEDSCLDLIFTNKPEKTSEVETSTTTSDHKYIQMTRYSKIIKTAPRYIVKRSYKEFDENVFLSEARKLSWLPLYLCEDVNTAAAIFQDNINSVLDRLAPIRKIQTRNHFAPWISEETTNLMEERNMLKEAAVRSQAVDDWNKYRTLRNKVNRRVKDEKVEWQKEKLKKCRGDPGQVWSNILGWLNWKTSNSPSKLYSDGKVETSPQRNAEIMNKYYVNKVRKIRAELPRPAVDPLGPLRQMMRGCPTTFQFEPVTPDCVDQIIRSMKNSKSCGLDNIDSYALKLLREQITPPLTHIINLSLTSGVFPTCFKMGKVVPLYKGKGELLEPSSYRPVCLLPVASKVLERCIFLQIVAYMEGNNYFHPNHHGFRSGHSTASALLQMYDSWLEDVDKQ
jgi:hypothetical protein